MGKIMRGGVEFSGNASVIYRNGIPYLSQGVPDYKLAPKTITLNGIYHPTDDNFDGYSEVIVDVPTQDPPVLTTKTITANGTYNASADNADGYSQVIVNEPLEERTFTSNGTYTPSGSNVGMSKVVVNVNQATETKSITSNGTYKPSSGKIGFSSVSVNVPSWVSISGSFSWRTTAGYLVTANLSGYSYVILKCRSSGYNDNYKKDVYIGMPTNGTQVFGGWRCVHNTGYGDFYGNCWVRLHADSRGIYLDEFNNANEATGSYQPLTYQALYGIR